MSIAARASALSPGATQRNMRDHNERLLLSLVRRNGPVAASDLARQAGLSPQTVSVILRDLETEGLLSKGAPLRGKVGKPSTPVHLNPDGVCAYGLKIGRRSADMALLGFDGRVRDQIKTRYRFPDAKKIFAFAKEGIAQLDAARPKGSKLTGLGIAAPYGIWKWAHDVDVPKAVVDQWKHLDLAEDMAEATSLPVLRLNDATAACHAENLLGRGLDLTDFLYVFVGAFIGGGVVLDGTVFEGRFGNAGALGPIPSQTPDGRSAPLLDTASLHLLEARIAEDGHDVGELWANTESWGAFDNRVQEWIGTAGRQIARAGLAACAVIDFEAIVIDGAFPQQVRADLAAAVRDEIARLDTRGLIQPEIAEGIVGANARVIGAGYGPIAAQHFLPGG